jgi:hypothetical protein
MSEDKVSFVDEVPEPDLNDPVMELKSGIYNLIISLHNNLVPFHGPVDAMQEVITFLEEIVFNFSKSIEQ